MIRHGDCLDVMAAMQPESVDAIVTDPPYGLEFMGKEWDILGGDGGWGPKEARSERFQNSPRLPVYGTKGPLMQEWHARWAEAAYRVAKPSSYLLAFGGTRTVHRMTVALEDAGWIIRDMLVWGYASGFPKSKASLKPAWEPIVMARKPGPLRMLAIDECRIPGSARRWTEPRGMGFSGGTDHGSVPSEATEGRWPANIVLTDPIFDGGWEGVVGGGAQDSPPTYVRSVGAVGEVTGWGRVEAGDEQVGYGDSGTYSRFYRIPVTIGACWYCGARTVDATSRDGATTDIPSGTAPASASSHPSLSSSDPAPSVAIRSGEAGGGIAHQPVPMWDDEASEPRSGHPSTSGTETTSSLAGTGTTPPTRRSKRPATSPASTPPKVSAKSTDASDPATDITTTTPSRLMCATCADLITSGSIVAADYPRFLVIPKADRADREPVLGGLPEREGAGPVEGHRGRRMAGDVNVRPDGRISRSRANVHPTVKPTDLMRHLVRLVTPTGGVVLDPFLGSGTTALAAELEGFDWIGIEREAEYVAIAEARLNGTQRGLGLGA